MSVSKEGSAKGLLRQRTILCSGSKKYYYLTILSLCLGKYLHRKTIRNEH